MADDLPGTVKDDTQPSFRVGGRAGPVPAAERALAGPQREVVGRAGGLELERDRAAVAATRDHDFGAYRGRSSRPSVITFRQ